MQTSFEFAWQPNDPTHQKFAKMLLGRACLYLRAEHGRTSSEGPRRILTAASQIVGTDIEGVNLKQANIARRVK